MNWNVILYPRGDLDLAKGCCSNFAPLLVTTHSSLFAISYSSSTAYFAFVFVLLVAFDAPFIWTIVSSILKYNLDKFHGQTINFGDKWCNFWINDIFGDKCKNSFCKIVYNTKQCSFMFLYKLLQFRNRNKNAKFKKYFSAKIFNVNVNFYKFDFISWFVCA